MTINFTNGQMKHQGFVCEKIPKKTGNNYQRLEESSKYISVINVHLPLSISKQGKVMSSNLETRQKILEG